MTPNSRYVPLANRETAPPLAGVRVLDCTNVIAGPTIGSSLARFGADVVKIDPTHTEFDPSCTVIYALQGGQGKRSVLVDLKQPAGRDVLERLACGADVVVHNGPRRQLDSLGLDIDSLTQANPRIVVCHLSAFDGPLRGPRSAQLGYDDLIQASTGIMSRFGGSVSTPEEHAHVGTVDVMAGYLGAFAAVLGILERDRHNRPVLVGTCLAAAGQLLQAPFMYDFVGRSPFNEPSGPFAKGEHALYRLYRAADGWLFLGMRRSQLPELARIPELAGIEAGDVVGRKDDGLAAWLEERLLCQSVGHWQDRMQELGIGALSVGTMGDLRARHIVNRSQVRPEALRESIVFIRDDAHPSGHTVDLAAPNAVRMRHTPAALPRPAPKFGEHTLSVLTELGYAQEEIQRLLDSDVVATSWSDQYLPD